MKKLNFLMLFCACLFFSVNSVQAQSTKSCIATCKKAAKTSSTTSTIPLMQAQQVSNTIDAKNCNPANCKPKNCKPSQCKKGAKGVKAKMEKSASTEAVGSSKFAKLSAKKE